MFDNLNEHAELSARDAHCPRWSQINEGFLFEVLMDASDRLLTTSEVGGILRLHRTRVTALIRAGKLPAIDIGNGNQQPVYRIRKRWVDEYLESNVVEPRC